MYNIAFVIITSKFNNNITKRLFHKITYFKGATRMPQPKSTAALLKQLRLLMQDVKIVPEPLNAYIVPSCDAHNSEYLAKSEARRAFITGFTGSEGTAIVTEDHACLWTDGRYYLQASQQIDANWTLMKEGLPSTPSQGEFFLNFCI